MFVTLKIKGDITPKIAMQLNLESHARGKRLQIKRYLMDVTDAADTKAAMQK